MTTYNLTPADRVPTVKPGDVINFARGGSWPATVLNGAGTADKPVKVGAFGTGPAPVFAGLAVRSPYTRIYDIAGVGAEWAGVHLDAPFVWLTRATLSGSITGVHVDGDDCRVVQVKPVSNNRMMPNTPGPYDDAGAFGVAVIGNRCYVDQVQGSGQYADSPNFGKDGSLVELYDAVGTRISRVVSWNNDTAIELGGKTSGTVITDLSVAGDKPNLRGIVTRGANDPFGPVLGTVVQRGLIHLPGAGSAGIVASGGATPEVLTMADLTVIAPDAIWTDGTTKQTGCQFVGRVTGRFV